jgi:hypothetical protein
MQHHCCTPLCLRKADAGDGQAGLFQAGRSSSSGIFAGQQLFGHEVCEAPLPKICEPNFKENQKIETIKAAE